MEPKNQDSQQLRKRWRRSKHLELLLVLVGMLAIESFLDANTRAQRALFNFLFLALILSAIRTLSSSRGRLQLAMILGFVAFVGSWICEVHPATEFLAVVYGCYTVVFSLLVLALCESVFAEGPVDSNRIIGAISIYFVLGLIWAFAYSLLELLQPGSFAISASEADVEFLQGTVSEFMYFSNMTLTTVGYGDIVPLSDPARMLAVLEAMFGQLYLAVIVARLVGLHISQSRD